MNLLKTLAAISSMTMLSRVTGLLRESLFARAFGASSWSDAFIVAFRIPNLLRRLFAEGAFAQAFVPILSEYKTQEGEERTKILVDHVATTLVWATVLVSVAGIIFSPALILLIATGLEKNTEAVFMTRLMFPYIACMSFVALAGGVLNTWRQFKIPAFTPVLLNVAFILASLFLVRFLQTPIYSMAIAVLVGGLLQVGLQIPALKKIGMLPHLSLNPLSGLRDPGVRRMLQKMGPAVFAVSAAQISLMINTNIASRLAPGSVSALSYADRLMEFPTAQPVQSQCRKRPHGIFRPAGLGPAPDLHAGHARRGRHGHPGRAPDRHPFSLRQIQRGRRGRLQPAPDGLQRRPAGHHPGQDPGARLLCAAGHQDPRAHRHRRADRDAADELCFRAPPGGGGPGPVDRPGRLRQRPVPLHRPAPARHLRGPAGLAAVPRQAGGGGGRDGRRLLVRPVTGGLARHARPRLAARGRPVCHHRRGGGGVFCGADGAGVQGWALQTVG